MKYKIAFFLLVALVMNSLLMPCQAQIYNSEIEAKIILEEEYGQISITGAALNTTNISQSLRYELSVIKGEKNSGNKSRNSQKGRIVLEAGAQKTLSNTRINSDDKQRIIILLLIYNTQEELVGKDRLILNGTEDEEQEKIILNKKKNNTSSDTDSGSEYYNDGVVLRGIVVEDTKTRFGSDFYKMFYTHYFNDEINGKEIVTIKESLAVGSNTKIEIFVAQKKVLEFVVRPQYEYLKAAKDEAIIRVRYYLNQLEQNKTQVQQY
ncbi:CsgE family curli-type amyloid fiber assembly protein [Rasiella sp. SM2506]|uniref:CsgE family curli-type amyloid fiber assembly protein n=1 Tax=Rasiella sp. SM2506 TaxID=3423914 RepID=UPI003D7B1AE8